MKDLDPGRSGRENYNPETEGKPADRSTGNENNPGGMQGSQSDRDRNKGQHSPSTDRDRKRGQQSDKDRDRGMQGSQGERDRDRAMGDPRQDPNDQSRAGSQRTHDELNDEDTAAEGGTGDRNPSRGDDRNRDRNR